jgi:hypothetical protein
MPFAIPRRNVVTVEATPSLQYSASMTGTKAVTTVIEKAELAQSYKAQPTTGRRSQ